MKSNGMRIKAMLLICALLVSLSLSSCTAFMEEASLQTTAANDNLTVPVVEGFLKNTSVNSKLRTEFSDIVEQMKRITDDSDGRLHIEYRMDRLKEGFLSSEYRVTMYLSDNRDSFELKSVTISGLDNVKAEGGEDPAWLHSAELAESALIMKRLGIQFDKASLAENSTEKNAIEVFLKLYEGFAGRETDVSEVKTDGETITKKAMLLGLLDYFGDSDYQYEDSVQIYNVTNYAEKILLAIERDVFGRQSESVTGKQFSELLRTFHALMRVHDVEGTEHSWSELDELDYDGVLSAMDKENDTLTRRDAAEFLGRITKDGPVFSMKYGDHNLVRVSDALDSIWVRRAVTHGFMNYYGDSTLFGTNEDLTLVNAISSARCYMGTRYSDWAYSANYEWDGNYTNEDIIISAAKVAEYFGDRDDNDKDFETLTVINDRDYDWFFSQRNTGKYSDINCMPSIATMASHWYDKNSTATVKKMRATSDSEFGWTAYELRFGLSSYDVPFVVEDSTLENIIRALDSGSIVLAQYSDRPEEMSGHCYVIYGYRQYRDSYTFIVNDSDSLSCRAGLFGRNSGNGDEIEARFAMWTISRFVDDVTVISSDTNNN